MKSVGGVLVECWWTVGVREVEHARGVVAGKRSSAREEVSCFPDEAATVYSELWDKLQRTFANPRRVQSTFWREADVGRGERPTDSHSKAFWRRAFSTSNEGF